VPSAAARGGDLPRASAHQRDHLDANDGDAMANCVEVCFYDITLQRNIGGPSIKIGNDSEEATT
jgi:hypothetical protein